MSIITIMFSQDHIHTHGGGALKTVALLCWYGRESPTAQLPQPTAQLPLPQGLLCGSMCEEGLIGIWWGRGSGYICTV